FVAHRVTEILDISLAGKWRHIPGELNPADDGSRGISEAFSTPQHRWFRGPDFLLLPELARPPPLGIPEPPNDDPECIYIENWYILHCLHIEVKTHVRDSVAKAGNIVCKHIPNFAACVELSTRHGPLRFPSIYLRPSISNFLTTVSPIFEVTSAPFAIIGTNVNASSRLWNSAYNDKRGSDLESFLVCSRLNVVNRPYTELDFVPAGTFFYHPYIFFEIDHGDFDKPYKKSYRPSVPTLPRINLDLYSIELAKALGRLPHPIHIESSEAVEAQIANLTSALSASAFAARVPVSRLKCSKNMVWWTKDLCVLRSRTRSLYKAWSKHKTAQSEQLYRSSKSRYQLELRAAKCRAWDKVRKSTTDGDVFRVLSDFKGKSKSIPLPSEILIDGAPSTDPIAIADGCARHCFPDEPPSDTAHLAVENEALASFHTHQDDIPPVISDWEFESAVRSLNPKSAPGVDDISADLLLFSLPLIKPYLSAILNACDWISTNQHGFRENRSTETAALSLISFIEGSFSDKKVFASAFLDLKSAFDSTWHPAIISALAKRACPNYRIKIIHSFLSNRQVSLSMNENTLKRRVNLGCPQGGVLSQFLLSLLVDDLLRLSFPFPVKMIAYADDITIVTAHKGVYIATQNLQTACDAVGTWLSTKKLFLDAVETVFVMFSRRQVSWDNLSILINRARISPSHSASFLGFVLDAHLIWDKPKPVLSQPSYLPATVLSIPTSTVSVSPHLPPVAAVPLMSQLYTTFFNALSTTLSERS
ncbi:Uncharacterized protein APZ42_025121, partial [Daphnia magna]